MHVQKTTTNACSKQINLVNLIQYTMFQTGVQGTYVRLTWHWATGQCKYVRHGKYNARPLVTSTVTTITANWESVNLTIL